MITGELKSKIDRIWDTMWSGGISNPLAIIEQLTYLLFMKRLDELHAKEKGEANKLDAPGVGPVFGPDQDALRWSRFKKETPEVMFETVRDQVFPFMKSLGSETSAGVNSTYSHHMQDAVFLIPTSRVLAEVVGLLSDIDMEGRDTKGDLYEYMLSKIGTAGQNGQFRTPRHIIELMVGMTAPQPHDTICDPACGSAGFLVGALAYLQEHHHDAIYKTVQSRRQLNENTFFGYDFDNTMLRIGSMNMLLHGVENPDIRYKDSLAQDQTEAHASFSLILANPPFAGSLDYESTAKSLLATVRTKKTELLFLALCKGLLRKGGRGAVVVPAGVLESDSKAHTEIRKTLVEDLNLKAVIKLPHWVFKPYASVDTSILVFSKDGATDGVWFYRVENDGFADDAQKTPMPGSEISEVLRLFLDPAARKRDERQKKHRMVSLEEIRSHNYDLCPPMYLSRHVYPAAAKLMALGEIFDISKGSCPASSARDEGPFEFVTSAHLPRRSASKSFEGPAICIPTVSATGHGHSALKTLHFVEGEFEASSITAVLIPKTPDVPILTIYYYLLAHKDDLLIPLMRGATNKSLSIDRLFELKVPILSQQSREAMAIKELLQLKKEISGVNRRLRELQLLHNQGVEMLRKPGIRAEAKTWEA